MALENNDEYTLVPKREIEALKREVETLKENPVGTTKQGKDLLISIKELNESIKDLIDIFSDAGKYFETEGENISVEKRIKPLNNKIDMLVDQNKKIANALVSMAGMIKNIKSETEHYEPKTPATFGEPVPKFNPPTGINSNVNMPPSPSGSSGGQAIPPPPKPSTDNNKKGLRKLF